MKHSYDSSASRWLSFKDWQLKHPSRWELARSGFYHSPSGAGNSSVTCVECRACANLHGNETLRLLHRSGCSFQLRTRTAPWSHVRNHGSPEEAAVREPTQQVEITGANLTESRQPRNPYTYMPLDPSRREIRLLYIPRCFLPQRVQISNITQLQRAISMLNPDGDISDFTCTISVVSLDDFPPYQALSYTWGDPDPAKYLSIQSGTPTERNCMRIQPNLNSALRNLSVEEDFERYIEQRMLVLWVDAVCINQNDDNEKKSQVNMMRDIYQQASSVIVWLGPRSESSDVAMETLLAMGRVTQALSPYQRTRHDGNNPDSDNTDSHDPQINIDMNNVREESLRELKPGDLDVAAAFGILFGNQIPSDHLIPPFPLSDIADLLSRPYWSRVWILQEFVLAKELIFACGRKRVVSDFSLRVFLDTWDHHDWEVGRMPRLIDHRPSSMMKARKERQMKDAVLRELNNDDEGTFQHRFREASRSDLEEMGFKSLRSLLQETAQADLGATDLRDKIYALLGLAEDGHELGIEVDYSKSVGHCELYTKVAAAIFAKGDLSLLAYCSNSPIIDLPFPSWVPSWVPNWSHKQGIIPLREYGGQPQYGTSPFSACKQLPASVDLERALSEGVMSVYGIQIDTVEIPDEMRLDISQNDVTEPERRQIIEWLHRTFQWLTPLQGMAYSTPEARKDAMWRTPIANSFQLPGSQPLAQADPAGELAYDALIGNQAPRPGQEDADVHHANLYFRCMMSVTNGRRPFSTSNGYIGIGSNYVERGDLVAIFLGTEIPYVIRRREDGSYRLIGEAYVHGVMYGEALERDYQTEVFELR